MYDDFRNYRYDVFHCLRCHKIVRTYEAKNDEEDELMLMAHRTLNCITELTWEDFEVKQID